MKNYKGFVLFGWKIEKDFEKMDLVIFFFI